MTESTSAVIRQLLRRIQLQSESDTEDTRMEGARQRLLNGDPLDHDDALQNILERALTTGVSGELPSIIGTSAATSRSSAAADYNRDFFGSRRLNVDQKLRDLIRDCSFVPVDFCSFLDAGVNFYLPTTVQVTLFRELKLPECGIGETTVESVKIDTVSYPYALSGSICYKLVDVNINNEAQKYQRKFDGTIFGPHSTTGLKRKKVGQEWVRPFNNYLKINLFDKEIRQKYILMIWKIEGYKTMYVCMRRKDGIITGAVEYSELSPQLTMLVQPDGLYKLPRLEIR